MTAHSVIPTVATTPLVRKVTLAGTIGSFVEWYDYGIYGLLVATIATQLVGGGDSAILITYVGFLVSFLVRPFGSVICGYLGDKLGRKQLLATLLLLISASTAAIGLIPNHTVIGVAAPILLIVLRMLQGFSAGGEVAGAMSFVGEYAHDNRRGFATSWIAVGSFVALLFGSLFVSGLIATFGQDALTSWAWRIPFLLALPLGVVGFYIRSRLEDTPHFTALRDSNRVEPNPLMTALRSPRHRRAIGLAIALPALNGPGYYILFVYMPTYLKTTIGFTQIQGLLVTACALLGIIITIPLFANLSDRVGRRPILIGSSIATGALAFPAFMLIQQGSLGLACVAGIVMAVAFSGTAAILHVTLIELFPTNVRYSAYSVGFAISTIIFGGSAPLLMAWLIGLTNNPSIPAYAVVLTALISLVTATGLKETAGEPLHEA